MHYLTNNPCQFSLKDGSINIRCTLKSGEKIDEKIGNVIDNFNEIGAWKDKFEQKSLSDKSVFFNNLQDLYNFCIEHNKNMMEGAVKSVLSYLKKPKELEKFPTTCSFMTTITRLPISVFLKNIDSQILINEFEQIEPGLKKVMTKMKNHVIGEIHDSMKDALNKFIKSMQRPSDMKLSTVVEEFPERLDFLVKEIKTFTDKFVHECNDRDW